MTQPCQLSILLVAAVVGLGSAAHADAPTPGDDADARAVADGLGPAVESPDATELSETRGDTILDNLASDDYQVRQRQTRALLADDELDLPAIVRLYMVAERPEQRHRLRDVLRHHVLRRQRDAQRPGGGGALGISHRGVPAAQSGELGVPIVEVLATMSGMPAHAVLEPGDQIIGFDGRALDDAVDRENEWALQQANVARPQVRVAAQLGGHNVAMQLSELIKSHAPGSEVELTILRGSEERRVRVRLTGAEALGTMYRPQGGRLQPRYAELWQPVRDRLDALVPPIQRLKLDVDAGE